MKTTPAAAVYISGLSPESSLIKKFMRQVFWLNLNLVAFPYSSCGTVAKITSLFPSLCGMVITATGIAPG
jgi:hypothetical protein